MHIVHMRSNRLSAFKPFLADVTLNGITNGVLPFDVLLECPITSKDLAAMFTNGILNDAMDFPKMFIQISIQASIWTVCAMVTFVVDSTVCDKLVVCFKMFRTFTIDWATMNQFWVYIQFHIFDWTHQFSKNGKYLVFYCYFDIVESFFLE